MSRPLALSLVLALPQMARSEFREPQAMETRCSLSSSHVKRLPAGTILSYSSCRTQRDSSWKFYIASEALCRSQAQALKGRCLGKQGTD